MIQKSGYIPEEYENTKSKKYVHSHVHYSIIYNT